MGREIRMVPPNWDHPKVTKYNPFRREGEVCFQPMFDEWYPRAALEWRDALKKFYSSGKQYREKCDFWEYEGNPPQREFYRPYRKKEATWFCVYETVSEGTPVTPPFKTREELADYLAENGDFWDQRRRNDGTSIMNCKPWGKEAAYKFVFGGGYMPSMVISNGRILSGGDLAGEIQKSVEVRE